MCLGWPESKRSCGWLPCFSKVSVNSSGNESQGEQTSSPGEADKTLENGCKAFWQSFLCRRERVIYLNCLPQEKNKGIPWYFVFLCLLLRLIRKIWANYPAEAAEEGGTRQLLLETMNDLWDQTPRGHRVLSWTSPFLELSWRVSLNETLNCLPKLTVTSTYENTVCFSVMLKFSFTE